MNAPEPRPYKGFMLYPCEPGSRARLNGWRWECFLGYGYGSAYAGTLADLERHITRHLELFGRN